MVSIVESGAPWAKRQRRVTERGAEFEDALRLHGRRQRAEQRTVADTDRRGSDDARDAASVALRTSANGSVGRFRSPLSYSRLG